MLSYARSATLTKAPIQNARMSALPPPDIPKNQPVPKESFASPNPIHRPEERSHKRKNGSATTTPASIFVEEGTRKDREDGDTHIWINASPENAYTRPSGMMACRMSYTAMTINSENKTSEKRISSAPEETRYTPQKMSAVAPSTNGY